MNTQFSFKKLSDIFFQGLGTMLAFVISLIIANILVPLSPEIMASAASASGFLSTPLAFLFNAAANALILVWVGRRSSFKGLVLVGQLFVLSFGTQTFQTQIETGYFLPAFPLLHNNFELYVLILRGFMISLMFSLLATWMVGGFSKQVSLTNCLYHQQRCCAPAYFLVGSDLHWAVHVIRLLCSLAGKGITPVLWRPGRIEWLFRTVGHLADGETRTARIPVFPWHFMDVVPGTVILGFLWQTRRTGDPFCVGAGLAANSPTGFCQPAHACRG